MPYAQIDVNFPEHWKALKLSAEAFKLFVVARCHAQKFITDGVIDARVLPTLRARTTTKVVEELLAVGLWEQTVSGYLIHDYADWNRTSDQIARKREYDKSYTSRKRVVNESGTSRSPATLRNATHRSAAQEHAPVSDTPAALAEEPARDPATGYVVGHARVGVGRSGGSMPGRSPHAAYQCEAFTVPVFLHQKFLGRLQNANDPAPEDTLQAWYRTLRDRMAGQETPAQEVQWLSAEFDAWRKPKAVVKPTADDDGAARLAAWAAQGAAS